MTVSKTGVTSTDVLLADLIDEIMDQQRRGEPVCLETYASKYPEHVQHLQELLPALEALQTSRSPPPPVAGPGSVGQAKMRREPGTEFRGGTLGDFRVLREIGRGGMGVVYEAEQVSLQRRVAPKMLPFAAVMDSRQLQRFENEARAAASLKHPGIVQVYSVGRRARRALLRDGVRRRADAR